MNQTATHPKDIDELRPCATPDCKGKARLRVTTTFRRIAPKSILKEIIDGDIPLFCTDCTEREFTEEVQAVGQRNREIILERRLDSSGIPRKWQGVEWADLSIDEPGRADVILALREWAEGRGPRGVFVGGPVGVGKSMMIGTAAMTRLYRSRVEWINGSELMTMLSLSFNDPQRRRATDILLADRHPSVAIVLDDIDKVKPDERGASLLYQAVHKWYEQELRVAISANSTLEDLADDYGDRYGDAIASRISEMCAVIELGGRDRRVAP